MLAGTLTPADGLTLTRMGYGAMQLAGPGVFGPPKDPRTVIAVLRAVVDAGVTHIDTADFYADAEGAVRANTLIREALHPYPAGLVLATKVGPVFGAGFREAAPEELRGLVEGNLEALGVDRLDLVYLRVGGMTPAHGESVAARFEALAALREEGLIRHLGLSNVDTAHLVEARAIAPVAAVQNRYNAGLRDDAELLALCEDADVAFVAFHPVGGGSELDDARLAKAAARHGVSTSRLALAWLLASSPALLAIPGTGTVAHLEDNMAAADLVLSEEDLLELA